MYTLLLCVRSLSSWRHRHPATSERRDADRDAIVVAVALASDALPSAAHVLRVLLLLHLFRLQLWRDSDVSGFACPRRTSWQHRRLDPSAMYGAQSALVWQATPTHTDNIIVDCAGAGYAAAGRGGRVVRASDSWHGGHGFESHRPKSYHVTILGETVRTNPHSRPAQPSIHPGWVNEYA